MLLQRSAVEENPTRWVGQVFAKSIPQTVTSSIAEWAEEHVRLVGSARSVRFSTDITPWWRMPINLLNDNITQKLTIVKPVQAGGSVVGEIALCYWVATASNGDIQYNWEDDQKALDRWDKRIEKILKATAPVMARWPTDRHKAKKGLVIFPHCNLTVQGVWASSNLDSDSIRFQINEEIHNMEPGRLLKAYGRCTAFWNSFILNISNGGKNGDQLHQAFLSGSQEHLENQCPKCKTYQRMRCQADKEKPGGLRYDAEGCRMGNGDYDYNRLASTIYYECENPDCRHRIRDTESERRQLSLSCRYGKPQNPGAPPTERSVTFEAVAVDYIPWIELIQEKHRALRAMKYGDISLYKRYIQEREAGFWNPEDRPMAEKIAVTKTVRKEGIPDYDYRFLISDKQRGEARKDEAPHFWVVIRDWKRIENGRIHTRLVYEGKVDLEEDLESLRAEYEVEPRFVMVDSGDQATQVYRQCAKYGYVAIKGEDREYYIHDVLDNQGNVIGKTQKIFSPLQSVQAFFGDHDGGRPVDVPYVRYSKQQIRDVLDLIRASDAYDYEIPEDVSEDYLRHWDSEEKKEFHHPRTGEAFMLWVQDLKRNDLFVCECYQALFASIVGMVGSDPVVERPNDVKFTNSKKT